MQLIKKILLLPIILIIFSCVTDNDAVREIPEYNEALLNKIEIYFNENKPERVIQLFDTFGDTRLIEYKKEAENRLIEKLEAEYSEGNYLTAAETLKSVKASGLKTDYVPEAFYIEEIIKLIQNEESVPAMYLFYNRIILQDKMVEIAEGKLEIILEGAIKTGNKTVLEYLKKNYRTLTSKYEKKINELLEYTPKTEELISGTVTIWVNRGIRIERGIGVPDRVIGSGFYIDERGYILTNYHVIKSEVDSEYEGFSRLYVMMDQNREKIPARVIGWDASLDLALLKAEIKPEYVYNFSSFKDYSPGEKIYAIGSPGGLEKTITSGIISASGNRRLLPIGDTIQVDVPINSGNSGGPVVDQYGNLVGVVFAGIEQFEGVNFIIPSKWIIKNLTGLFKEGRNLQTWLGLTVHENEDGLEVVYIMPGTSAFNSRILTGDQIITIDGIKVEKITEAQEVLQDRMPDSLINIQVKRNDKIKDLLLVTEKREDIPLRRAIELDSRKNLLAPFIGMSVRPGDEKIIGQQYIITKVYRGTPADETGLSVDDPFSIVKWEVDDEYDVLIVGIRIKKRKAGFLETAIQLGNYIDINSTI